MARPINPRQGKQFFEVQVKSIQNGELCYWNSRWVTSLDSANITTATFAAEFEDKVLSLVRPFTSIWHTYLSLRVTGGPNLPIHVRNLVDYNGLEPGNVLPVWNTFYFIEYTMLDTQFPLGEKPIERGRVSLSGVPEATQQNGVIESPAAVAFLGAFATRLETFTTAGGVEAYGYIRRFANTLTVNGVKVNNPVTDVFIGSCAYVGLGTQNTRKP